MKSSGPGFPPHPELFSVCVLLLLVQRETGRQGGYLGGDGFLLRLNIKGAGRDLQSSAFPPARSRGW